MKQQETVKKLFANILLKKGRKFTSEKILKQSFKNSQKTLKKNTTLVIKKSLINSASTFKVDTQTLKKGKRKSQKTVLGFLVTEKNRQIASLKTLALSAKKQTLTKKYSHKLFNELREASKMTGNSIDLRNELNKNILSQKKYVSKFKW